MSEIKQHSSGNSSHIINYAAIVGNEEWAPDVTGK
jgi:hypothetical protein